MMERAKGLNWAGVLLGVALGGFFDGILLHQILQWHHLLSNVDGVQDLRMQVFFDGVFHLLMYLVGLAGLIMLWRARRRLDQAGSGRRLVSWCLIGFGLWHVLDAVLSHWILGIHRIRMDTSHPWLWDGLWFVVFGLGPLVWGGWRLRQSGGPGASGSGGRGASESGTGGRAAVMLSLLVLVAGPWAALPADSTANDVVVLFAPGISSSQAVNALIDVDARIVWADRSGGIWAVRLENSAAAWKLYGRGAMMVGNAGVGLGCLSWLRV